MPEHPPVEKVIFGLPISIDFEKGMKLPEEFGLSTNWPLFADMGRIKGTKDPLNEEKEIIVLVGEDLDFSPNVFICLVNVGGDKRTVVYLGVPHLHKVMMIKAGIYLSSEVERIIERPVLDFANEIRTFGTVKLGTQMELVEETGGTEHDEEDDRETVSVDEG